MSAVADPVMIASLKGENVNERSQFQQLTQHALLRWSDVGDAGTRPPGACESVYKARKRPGADCISRAAGPPHQDEKQVEILPAPPACGIAEYAVFDKKTVQRAPTSMRSGIQAARAGTSIV